MWTRKFLITHMELILEVVEKRVAAHYSLKNTASNMALIANYLSTKNAVLMRKDQHELDELIAKDQEKAMTGSITDAEQFLYAVNTLREQIRSEARALRSTFAGQELAKRQEEEKLEKA